MLIIEKYIYTEDNITIKYFFIWFKLIYNLN